MRGTGIEINGREIFYDDVICRKDKPDYLLTAVSNKRRNRRETLWVSSTGYIYHEMGGEWEYKGNISDYPDLKKTRDRWEGKS